MPQTLSIGESYAAYISPVGKSFALEALTHLPTGCRLTAAPLELFEIECAGQWLGSSALGGQLTVGIRSAGDKRRDPPAQIVFNEASLHGTLILAVCATAEGGLSLTFRAEGASQPLRVRIPLISALAAGAAREGRAALTLNDASFRWETLASGRADGALFLPNQPHIPLWRTNFLPTGTLLSFRVEPQGFDTLLWINRRREALASAFAEGGRDIAIQEVFQVGGAAAGTETLELTIGGTSGGWRGWLAEQRRRLLARLDLSAYERADLRWLRRCFVAGYVFCYERDFYDERRGGYCYQDLFARAEREIGGFDLIMLCQGSPRLGIDSRNQHDLHRDVPGGLPALRDFVAEAHRHGSRVVYDYRPWDTCTRQSEYPHDHLAGFVELLRETDMDGAFNDTGDSVPTGFRAAADAVRAGIAFTSEFSPATERDLEEHVSSWAQQPGDRNEPAIFVDALKFLLPLHQVHLASRWSRYHPRLLAQALFNGQGFYLWESHYGSWTVWGPASRAMVKRCGAIMRANADAFSSLEWEPLVPTLESAVYANRWPAGGKQLFTLTSSSDVPAGMPILAVPHTPEARYVDLWNRRELTPDLVDGTARIAAQVAVGVPACVGVFHRRLELAETTATINVTVGPPYDATGGTSPPVAALRVTLFSIPEERVLPAEQIDTARWRIALPSDSGLPSAGVMVEALDHEGNLLDVAIAGGAGLPAQFAPRDEVDNDGGENLFAVARLISPRVVSVSRATGVASDDGMVHVPGGSFQFVVESCDKPERFSCYHQDENHAVPVNLRPYLLDRHPVTNGAFQRFLDDSGYRPSDPTNFLRHWGDGAFPPPKGDHPVVNVSVDDARAFAAWAGKRLPTEAEWQYAAQGPDRRRWPWGNVFDPLRCNGSGDGTTPVDDFPFGASPFGCLDLCGNVWELTDDQYDDGHHYYLILKGGSWYRVDERGLAVHETIYARRWPAAPRGSDGRLRMHFYRRGGAQPVTHHLRFLQMGAALDRGETIGFRCAKDA